MRRFGSTRMSGGFRVACQFCVVATLVSSVAPQASFAAGPTSAQVAAEIVRLQGKADELAQRITESEDRATTITAESAASEQGIAELTGQVGTLEAALNAVALDQFVHDSAGSITGLLQNPTLRIEADVFRELAVQAGGVDLDVLEAARHDLDLERRHLARLAAENTQLTKDLAQASADLDAQLVQLETLRVKLKDAETKRAYEALVAKKRAAEEAARAEAARRLRVTIIEIPGAGGGSDAPIPPPGWVCPVNGAVAFGDTWGSPRPNGRHHQGVDMMAASWTPLVAVVAGFVRMKTDPLGGNVASLNGVDGTRYYYAHLSSWEGGDRNVSAGDVVGYVGHTGDTQANHLHLEIHPHGGSAVNPYPTVRRYC
jgi:peptidoglycan LD-endopeptidase LytH